MSCDERPLKGSGRSTLLAFLAALVGAWMLSCSSGPESPEEQIRSLIAAAQQAGEERDLETLMGFVSDSYADDVGRDKEAIRGTVAYHFLRNPSIHLYAKIDAIVVTEPPNAEAAVYVAMADRRILGPSDLARLRADLYRFDLTFFQEDRGEWKVTRAKWRPAQIADFF